jgi:CheY-like chemotaxis protein
MNTQIERTPILVVDDNPTDVFFLEHRLHAAGILHPLQHVEDGVEAVRVLERCDPYAAQTSALPWLVFLDLKMPRMDGFEVLAWLHERQLIERMTIAVLSTSDEPEDVKRATRLGAHRFLVKYPQPSELAAVVKFAIERVGKEGCSAEATGTPK